MRERIDPRVWPVLVLGVMLGWGCRAGPGYVSAVIVNGTAAPVTVEYRGQSDDHDVERVSVRLAPGGEFQRRMVGYDIRAGAVVSSDRAEGRLPAARLTFDAFGDQTFVLEDGPEGLVAHHRRRRPGDPP